MTFSSLENTLWAAGFVGHLCLLAVLLFKKHWHSFPIFTSFIVYSIAHTAILFLVARYGDHQIYRNVYWTLAAFDYAFQIAIIIELGRSVLRPESLWLKKARRDFVFWSMLGAVIAAGLALAVTPPNQTGLNLWSARSMVFTALLTCTVFLAMVTSANRLNLQWRSHAMTLGQGLTAWAGIGLASDTIRYAVGWPAGERFFDVFNSAVYLGALVFWTISFALPERKSPPLPDDTREYLLSLHAEVSRGLSVLSSRETR